MYVTEDTTRARPETIRKLYTAAIECGARRVVVTDTVGHATPSGVRALASFMKGVVKATGEDVKIDWHGHSDRGLSVPNSLSAIEAGCDRVHACALGIGERCGNTPMDILLVNLKLSGRIANDLSRLSDYCRVVSDAVGVAIPANYPIVGEDAFRTGTGVHAAAVIKALKRTTSGSRTGSTRECPRRSSVSPKDRGRTDERYLQRSILASTRGQPSDDARWCGRSSRKPRPRTAS
jgi:2-isopropylmalate synthase